MTLKPALWLCGGMLLAFGLAAGLSDLANGRITSALNCTAGSKFCLIAPLR